MNASNRTRTLTTPVPRLQPSTPDFRWLARLPHHHSLELDACDKASGMARDHLRALLREWALPEFTEAVTQVASELIANSVAETDKIAWPGPRPLVRVSLRAAPSAAALMIWDAVTRAPIPRAAGDYDENGRGLAIVEYFSARWGYYYPPDSGGKVTWSIIG